ncbi:MAG: SDR family NAD(P)-dependent oxidoreductase [Thermodesulfobacteriota bacterium]
MNIAIVGMGCVYPGAHSPEELWTNILAGRRYFRTSPDERLPNEWYFHPDPESPGKTYCDRMAVITDWSFDPVEWKIPPVTINTADICHWLSLHTVREAIKDAGFDLKKTDKKRVGVVLGNSGSGEFFRSHMLKSRWPYVERAVRNAVQKNFSGDQADALVEAIHHFYSSPLPEINEDFLAGNIPNVIAGRVANYFDFRSGAYTVDGACASSLLAVTNACNHLAMGDMDVAFAGGVDVSLDPFEIVGFAKTKALAKEDIRPYDERAHGMQTGEGCGIVALATEDYAKRHGYDIHAVIKGWGVSSDGAGGITQPQIEGQGLAIEKTYKRAGYPVSTVGYVEGHGTGTAVGDKIEISALKKAIDESKPDDSHICYLGSIKANIGHTKAAAGVAGLIKAVMALKRKIIPPHTNWHVANPAFGTPLTNLRPSYGGFWDTSGPRRASVSAFGFGGVNTHIALEEANQDDQPDEDEVNLIASVQSSEVIALSGKSERDLLERIEKLISLAQKICQAELIDLSAVLAQEKPKGSLRLAIVAKTPWGLTKQLQMVHDMLSAGKSLGAINNPARDIFAGQAIKNPTMVGLFPGQGSHRLNMASHFLRRYPFVREICHDFEARMYALTGESFRAKVFRDLHGATEETIKRWTEELRETVFQQPSIVSCSMAAFKVLDFLGLKPDFTVGHSLGEISALAAGGGVLPIDALQIAALRAQAMNNASGKGTGGMAAIGIAPSDVEKMLNKGKFGLVVSNYNSPRQTVVSGKLKDIQKFLGVCEKEGVWARSIPVSHAFHSKLVAPASKVLRKELDSIPIMGLDRAHVYSTATGNVLPSDVDIRELLGNQIAQPVRFMEAIENIAKQKPTLWIEIGPGTVLTNLVKDILGEDNVESYPTDLEREDDFHLMNRLVSRAYVLGFPVRMNKLFEHRLTKPFDIEQYDPVLIVNPSEKPVLAPEKELNLTVGSGAPLEILPDEAQSEDFDQYLAQRHSFIKQFLKLDYQSWPGNQEGLAELPQGDESQPEEVKPAFEPAKEDESVLEIAVNWISARTGFPIDFITPDKKLRDDLNLDSIKAGELALMLSKKIGTDFPLDPGMVSNASIQYLVDTVVEHTGERTAVVGSASEAWLKMFGLELLPAPISDEEPLPIKKSKTFYVIGDNKCARAKSVVSTLKKKGIETVSLKLSQAADYAFLPSVGGVIIVLPETKKSFLEVDAEGFTKRVEGLATDLFKIMKNVLHKSNLQDDYLQAFVVRPVSKNDAGMDIDGAAGLLRTLAQEYDKPNYNWKWLTVPGKWNPSKVAGTVFTEMQHLSDRVEFHLSEDGTRLSPTTVQTAEAPKKAKPLNSADTLLVSGGGKGITFEMAFALAQKTGVKLGLMGSSPLPGEGSDSELAKNLKRLDEKAIPHQYVQADVTDAQAVAKAVKKINKQLGAVTAILHGAGISQFAEFKDMELESYLKCIRIKAFGLYNLLKAAKPKHLKALHVLSSVLGRTGMFRQADYAFANAWLDAATKSVLKRFPQIDGFSVGYSIWEDIGIGAKSGSLDMLRGAGVTPIPIERGISSYVDLATRAHSFKNFVYMGRLSNSLERKLMPTVQIPKWRFLEKILRFVPGVDLVTEATLTHHDDKYIPEHVFAGTPLMPTVLGLESMVQAAKACIGTNRTPVIRDIQLKRPMIIPEEIGTKVQTYVLVGPTVNGVTSVKASMRSDSDGFTSNHFEIECLFGLPSLKKNLLPKCPSIPKKKYSKSPEEFSPSPLFQGRFLRRISKIYGISDTETLTEITVPVEAQYYSSGFEQNTQTPSPAVRDAMLQSAALGLPAGFLPDHFDEFIFFRPYKDGEKVVCWSKVVSRSDSEMKADITVFDKKGKVVEMVKGFIAKAPSTKVNLVPERKTKTIPLEKFNSYLKETVGQKQVTVFMVAHKDMAQKRFMAVLPENDRKKLIKGKAKPRHESLIGNIVAGKMAASRHLELFYGAKLPFGDISIQHAKTGKPELAFNGSQAVKTAAIDISLADGTGTSYAMIGEGPVGIDSEKVEPRTTELWNGLLGDDGYSLAMRLMDETGESFDLSATRVWTLIEAGKKANSLKRVIPELTEIFDRQWIVFKSKDSQADTFLSTVCTSKKDEIVITIAGDNIFNR